MPVTGSPGSARALDTILIDGIGYGWKYHPHPIPQAVIAPVPASLAVMGNCSLCTGYKQALVLLFIKVRKEGQEPLHYVRDRKSVLVRLQRLYQRYFFSKIPSFTRRRCSWRRKVVLGSPSAAQAARSVFPWI